MPGGALARSAAIRLQVGAENGVRTSILKPTVPATGQASIGFPADAWKVIEQGDEPQPAARKPAAKKQQGA